MFLIAMLVAAAVSIFAPQAARQKPAASQPALQSITSGGCVVTNGHGQTLYCN